MPEKEDAKDEGIRKSPEEARQAKIVLREPWQRWTLFLGAGVAIVLALLFAFGIAV
jgi:hypothetical protein